MGRHFNTCPNGPCRCIRCEDHRELDRHHIVARMDGGSDDPSNLAWLCATCHHEWHEHGQDVVEFEAWLSTPSLRLVELVAIRLPSHVPEINGLWAAWKDHLRFEADLAERSAA